MMIFSLVAVTGLGKCCITSAYLQWLCHSGERPVAHGPLVFFLAILPLRKHILSQFQIFMTLVLQILNVTQSETIQCNPNIVDEFQIIFFSWVLRSFQEFITYIEPIVHQRWPKPENAGNNRLTIHWLSHM